MQKGVRLFPHSTQGGPRRPATHLTRPTFISKPCPISVLNPNSDLYSSSSFHLFHILFLHSPSNLFPFPVQTLYALDLVLHPPPHPHLRHRIGCTNPLLVTNCRLHRTTKVRRLINNAVNHSHLKTLLTLSPLQFLTLSPLQFSAPPSSRPQLLQHAPILGILKSP